jgi:hypothetical protein
MLFSPAPEPDFSALGAIRHFPDRCPVRWWSSVV